MTSSAEKQPSRAYAGVSVARVDPDGWRRLREIRLAGLAEAPEMFGSTYARELAFDEEEWRTRAARPATYIASRDGVDIGTAGVFELDSGWWVMGMWVAPEARGSGVVEALVEACEATVREAGAQQVNLGVMGDNPRGIAAYERLGYTFTGATEHVRDGRDELMMVKQLR